MSDYNVLVSEKMYPLAGLVPEERSTGTYDTGYVNLKNYHRAWVVLYVGDLSTNSTVDLALFQATDTSSTGEKAISGKSITQLDQSDGDDNAIVCIELQTEEMDVANEFNCLRARLTVGTADANTTVFVYGVEPRFEPVPTTNWEERIL